MRNGEGSTGSLLDVLVSPPNRRKRDAMSSMELWLMFGSLIGLGIWISFSRLARTVCLESVLHPLRRCRVCLETSEVTVLPKHH
jgi:hypothetical protein